MEKPTSILPNISAFDPALKRLSFSFYIISNKHHAWMVIDLRTQRDPVVPKNIDALDAVYFIKSGHHTGNCRSDNASANMQESVLEITLRQCITFINIDWAMLFTHTMCNTDPARSVCNKASIACTVCSSLLHQSVDHLVFLSKQCVLFFPTVSTHCTKMFMRHGP